MSCPGRDLARRWPANGPGGPPGRSIGGGTTTGRGFESWGESRLTPITSFATMVRRDDAAERVALPAPAYFAVRVVVARMSADELPTMISKVPGLTTKDLAASS